MHIVILRIHLALCRKEIHDESFLLEAVAASQVHRLDAATAADRPRPTGRTLMGNWCYLRLSLTRRHCVAAATAAGLRTLNDFHMFLVSVSQNISLSAMLSSIRTSKLKMGLGHITRTVEAPTKLMERRDQPMRMSVETGESQDTLKFTIFRNV